MVDGVSEFSLEPQIPKITESSASGRQTPANPIQLEIRFLVRADRFHFLYGIVYLQLGYLFRNEVNGVLNLLSEFGMRLMAFAAVLILIFVAYKWVQRRKSTKTVTERAPQGADSIPAT